MSLRLEGECWWKQAKKWSTTSTTKKIVTLEKKEIIGLGQIQNKTVFKESSNNQTKLFAMLTKYMFWFGFSYLDFEDFIFQLKNVNK